MKLRFSATSPFVRKVMVTLYETGLLDQVEMVPTNVWDTATDIADTNPLGKVPALTLDDGTVYIESAMICEYLDSLHDGVSLFPAPGPARWQTLRLQALADGLLGASVDRVIEVGRRPKDLQWADWLERRKTSTARTLDLLEREVSSFFEDACIGQITLGCALGYVDFRFDGDQWRNGRPRLTAWYDDGFAKRPSMIATVPKDPS